MRRVGIAPPRQLSERLGLSGKLRRTGEQGLHCEGVRKGSCYHFGTWRRFGVSERSGHVCSSPYMATAEVPEGGTYGVVEHAGVDEAGFAFGRVDVEVRE